MKIPKGFELIGEVGVDSGQLMVCDPCYIESQWDHRAYEQVAPMYRHEDGTNYYCLCHGVSPGHKAKAFAHFDKVIKKYGLSMNDMLRTCKASKVDVPSRGDFSYAGCCQATNSAHDSGQLGEATGVVFCSGYGDGCYPVIARRNKEGRIVEVRIKMS